MPELIEVFNNEDAYTSTSWVSEWIDVASTNNLVFTTYCDQNYEVGVRWAVDNNYFVINEKIISVLANESYELFEPVTARFVQFFIQNIASTPAELRSQGFFYLKAGGGNLEVENGGTGESLVIDGVGPDVLLKGLLMESDLMFYLRD
jgi:hypothetical protein